MNATSTLSQTRLDLLINPYPGSPDAFTSANKGRVSNLFYSLVISDYKAIMGFVRNVILRQEERNSRFVQQDRKLISNSAD